MSKTLCIYHGNCADGFGAAWVVRKALGEDAVEFFAATHQRPPPPVEGRNVLIVDFSYKRPVMEKILNQARAVVVLDHHKSAIEDLDGLFTKINPMPWDLICSGVPSKGAVFDIYRSGAGITWDFFFPQTTRPSLINHIEDRDLWVFNLPGTREIQANLFSHPYDFGAWDIIAVLLEEEDLKKKFIIEGEAIERKHFKDIKELLEVVTRPMKIGGYAVPVANLPYTMVSDAGQALCKDHPFAACYYDSPDGRNFSLRSEKEGGIDVSKIAEKYGGGGHENAAGFRVTYKQAREFEL